MWRCAKARRQREMRGAAPSDDSLRGIFHYNLARDLGQLGPARVLTVLDARRLYQEIGAARGMVTGNIKLEALLLCDDARAATLIHESHRRGVA